MNGFVLARFSSVLVLFSPLIFLALLYTSPGDVVSVVGLALFYGAYLAAVAMFLPIRPILGVRPWSAWLIACSVLAIPPVTSRLVSGSAQAAGGDAAVGYACAAMCALAATAVALLSRRYRRSEAIDLPFPLRGGVFDAVQAGSTRLVNHHAVSREQRYGVDIVQVRANALADLLPATPENFAIFGRPVYSPTNAVIAGAADGLPDVRDVRRPFGNHVVLERDDGVRLVFAHLKQGTVAVAQGQHVRPGDLLGAVGNSGNSTEPHLHVHAERDGAGIPLTFGGRYLVRNSSIQV